MTTTTTGSNPSPCQDRGAGSAHEKSGARAGPAPQLRHVDVSPGDEELAPSEEPYSLLRSRRQSALWYLWRVRVPLIVIGVVAVTAVALTSATGAKRPLPPQATRPKTTVPTTPTTSPVPTSVPLTVPTTTPTTSPVQTTVPTTTPTTTPVPTTTPTTTPVSTTVPTTTPTTSPVTQTLTYSVTVSCPVGTTLTAVGTGSGVNTLTVSGGSSPPRSETGSPVTISVNGPGVFDLSDTDTGGTPGIRWSTSTNNSGARCSG